jgi:hypothetical protein
MAAEIGQQATIRIGEQRKNFPTRIRSASSCRMTHAPPDSRPRRSFAEYRWTNLKAHAFRCARAARQCRRGGARDAAVGLQAQTPGTAGRRRLGAGAGDRPRATPGRIARDRGPSRARRRFAAARRRFRSKVTLSPAKATLSGRKATPLPLKVTVSAVFAFGPCQHRQHRVTFARPEEAAKQSSRRMRLAPCVAFRKSATR